MNTQTTCTLKPFLANRTLERAPLFLHWFAAFITALVSLEVIPPVESSAAHPTFNTPLGDTSASCCTTLRSPLSVAPMDRQTPLLLNHLQHTSHCAAPSCSLTGLLLSAAHLYRALSPFRPNCRPHTSHSTFLSPLSLPLCCASWCLIRFSLQALLHFPLSWATLYQSSPTCTACMSFLIMSLHLLRGPPQGLFCGNHPKRHSMGSQ